MSAAEYDEMVRRYPAHCIFHALGDRRSGQQLLDDYEQDDLLDEAGYASYLATPRGAAYAERLLVAVDSLSRRVRPPPMPVPPVAS